MAVEASDFEKLSEAADGIRRLSTVRPRLAIVLGSGLGPLADEVKGDVIEYAAIPHMPRPAAVGHAGKIVLGTLENCPVAILSGRSHLYEGFDAQEVVFGTRLMKFLDAEALIITNAAGAVNLNYRPGMLMLIADQINLTGHSPLVGPSDRRLGPRFPDMSEAYDPKLRALAHRGANERNLPVVEGVYMGLLGPSYETPAEIRMARTLGADAVGMSTVLEVIAANHVGLRVLGISCLTNMASGILHQKLTEEEVIDTANRVREEFSSLVRGIVRAFMASSS